MRLDHAEATARLAAMHHGVLATVHPVRGVDAVPCVFAFDGEHLGVPVDRVKAKASLRLQRERNLEADPRATLLVERWDDDWSRLWWVRAELRAVRQPPPDVVSRLADRLADRHPQYRDRPFERIVVLRVAGVTGWAATG